MIVVVGGLGWRQGDPAGPAGRACEVALAAAAAGARVEIVARAGDDATGDALMLALSRAGIGHVAVLRDPSHPTPILAGRWVRSRTTTPWTWRSRSPPSPLSGRTPP